jgi:hypothetical protein
LGAKLPDPKVAIRYGVVVRTLERWDQNPELGFPKPFRINRRRYRDVDQLDEWDRKCAAAGRATRTPPAAGKPTDNREVKPTAKSAQPAETTT